MAASQTTINGSIERLIMAKFNKQMNGKDVDVTYGGPVPSGNTTFDALTLVPVEGQSLIAGRRYIHNDMFDVLENAPKVRLRGERLYQMIYFLFPLIRPLLR